MYRTKVAEKSGQAFGITIGCLLGVCRARALRRPSCPSHCCVVTCESVVSPAVGMVVSWVEVGVSGPLRLRRAAPAA